MQENPSIIFLNTSSYLSIPQYLPITPFLDGYNNILLDTKDPSVTPQNKVFYINEAKKVDGFHSYHELGVSSSHVEGLWKKYQFIKGYEKEIKNYCNKIKPKAIVSCSDRALSDRLITSWCKKNNIPFIILQPSIIHGVPVNFRDINLRYRMKYFLVNKLMRIPRYSRQLRFGEESPKTYLFLWSDEFIFDPSRGNIFTIGNPAFDKQLSEFSPIRRIKKNILICTQPIEERLTEVKSKVKLEEIYEMYIEAIKSHSDFNFYIKVHPRESIEKYKNIIENNGLSNIKFVKDSDLTELLKICDVQISVTSATAFYAIATGTPIILLNPNKELGLIDFFRDEIGIKVFESKEIGAAIDLALSDEYWNSFIDEREKYFKKMFYSTDGKSGKRAAEKIKELILTHQSKVQLGNVSEV